MDKDNVKFDEVLDEIRTKLGKQAIPFTYPLGHNDGFDGFANCVDLKAHIYDGVKCNEAPIYDDKKDKVFELYNAIAEEVAKTDDALLEKFFNAARSPSSSCATRRRNVESTPDENATTALPMSCSRE